MTVLSVTLEGQSTTIPFPKLGIADHGAALPGEYPEGEDAFLEGAILAGADGLVLDQITRAHGDSRTTLPEELTRPEH